jgi:hypothetical protein
MRIARCSVVLTIGLVIGLFVSAGLAQADDTAWKAAHDTDPHVALTPAQRAVTAAKRAAEGTTRALIAAPIVVPWSECGAGCGGNGSYPPSASLPANQIAQITSYYCGPAAVHEALGVLGVSLSQSAAATALNTTTNGTAWSGGGTSPSGYPVPDVLNNHENRNQYVPQPVSAANATTISRYENDLKMDIVALGVPLLGDAWEVPGGYHLVGHPGTLQIFHWFEIRGYQNSGASTMYEDSVHGASSIGWSPSVPAYSTLASSTIVSIVSGRGYIW